MQPQAKTELQQVGYMLDNNLFLILKGKYFNKIKNGEKKSEYRLLTEYWLTRLTSKEYEYVTFQLGYAANAERIVRRIIDIKISTIESELFGGNPVDVFEIVLE